VFHFLCVRSAIRNRPSQLSIASEFHRGGIAGVTRFHLAESKRGDHQPTHRMLNVVLPRPLERLMDAVAKAAEAFFFGRVKPSGGRVRSFEIMALDITSVPMRRKPPKAVRNVFAPAIN
jgi:hypothetical protein